MKSIFHTMAAAALLGCLTFPASAMDAGKQVAAQFNATGSNKPTEFSPVAGPSAGKKGGMFGNFEPIGNSEFQWQVLNIPVRVGAGKVSAPGGDKVVPNYISEITFHVYVRVEATVVDKSGKKVSDKRKSCITLDKEITYVDIPLHKAGGNVTIGTASVDAYADMQVAVFLSPSDICRITEDDTHPYTSMDGKTQPKVKVVAVAMEATYKGTSCWRTAKGEKTDFLVVDSSIGSSLQSRWWKSSGSSKGAMLRSISETPFAADYYPYYCPTKPLFGSADPSSSSSSDSQTGSADDSSTDTPDAGDTGAGDVQPDDSATDATESDDSSTGSKGKRKKDRKKNK